MHPRGGQLTYVLRRILVAKARDTIEWKTCYAKSLHAKGVPLQSNDVGGRERIRMRAVYEARRSLQRSPQEEDKEEVEQCQGIKALGGLRMIITIIGQGIRLHPHHPVTM